NKVKNGAAFTLSDEKKYYQFLLPAAPMTTYRIKLDLGVAKLFKWGSSTVVQESKGTVLPKDSNSRNYLYFGDSGAGVDGTSTWEFVRWTNAGILPRTNQT